MLLPKQRSKVLQAPELRQLKEQGFPLGLAETLTRNNEAFPLRIWVVDNSGSMIQGDGHRFVETKKAEEVKVVSCTRWSEIQVGVLIFYLPLSCFYTFTNLIFFASSSGNDRLSCSNGSITPGTNSVQGTFVSKICSCVG